MSGATRAEKRGVTLAVEVEIEQRRDVGIDDGLRESSISKGNRQAASKTCASFHVAILRIGVLRVLGEEAALKSEDRLSSAMAART
mgnify:CR=1 FL=1